MTTTQTPALSSQILVEETYEKLKHFCEIFNDEDGDTEKNTWNDFVIESYLRNKHEEVNKDSIKEILMKEFGRDEVFAYQWAVRYDAEIALLCKFHTTIK